MGRSTVDAVTAALALSVATLLNVPASAQQPTADVVHWLTSGAESEAVKLLAKEFERRGGKWIDSAAPGGPGDAQAILMNRVAGGTPPGVAFLAIGHSAVQLGQSGVLRNVKDLAAANGVGTTSEVMIKLSTDRDGALYALPIAIDTDNLAWFSKPVYDAAGLSYPKTWVEFLDQAKVLKQKGFIPIAVGAQGWQLGLLFNTVLLGQDEEVFDAVVNRRDPKAAGGDKVVAAFTTLRTLSTCADAGASNRAWNDTLNLVAQGKAGMQIMGSWAGAELSKMGSSYGTQWSCTLAPGSRKLLIEGDGFEFPKDAGRDATAGQDLFVQVMMDPKLQADFAVVKGALPSRLDADTSKLSACDQMAANALRTAGGVPTVSAVLTNEGAGQLEDLMSNFWANPTVTPEQAAADYARIISSGN